MKKKKKCKGGGRERGIEILIFIFLVIIYVILDKCFGFLGFCYVKYGFVIVVFVLVGSLLEM